MILVELNYNIYNKELLNIVIVLKEWRVFLYSTTEPFKVITNYKNLVGFLTIKEFIKYYFKIKYVKGIKNTRADTLRTLKR